MIQRREHPRFALEARAPVGIGRERERQDLDRDVAPELVVARAVDLAHAPDAEQRADRVRPEALADELIRAAAPTPRSCQMPQPARS